MHCKRVAVGTRKRRAHVSENGAAHQSVTLALVGGLPVDADDAQAELVLAHALHGADRRFLSAGRGQTDLRGRDAVRAALDGGDEANEMLERLERSTADRQ